MIVRVGYNRRQAHVHKHSDPLLVCSDASCQQLQPRGRGARRVCDVCDNRPAVLVHEELECLNLCHHARSHCVCTNLTVITAIQRTSRSHNSVNILSGYIRSWSRAVWRARAATLHQCCAVQDCQCDSLVRRAPVPERRLAPPHRRLMRRTLVRSTAGGLVEIGPALTPKCGAVDGQAMRAQCLVIAECAGAVRAHMERARVQRVAVPCKLANFCERCGAVWATVRVQSYPCEAPARDLACQYSG